MTNTFKGPLVVGKTYELNNGKMYICKEGALTGVQMNGLWYHSDGRFGAADASHPLSVRRCVSDTPKTWGEMTDAEKGELLLAHHRGKAIEAYIGEEWVECYQPRRSIWGDIYAYRVKPEPYVETITLFGRNQDGSWAFTDGYSDKDTHVITLTIRDGEADPVAAVDVTA
jgi:hypothetical protein